MKFRVNAECVISISTVVEARSASAALRIAKQRNVETIITSGDENSEWTTSGELDGTPQNLKIEDVG